jgi:hypothetical protein
MQRVLADRIVSIADTARAVQLLLTSESSDRRKQQMQDRAKITGFSRLYEVGGAAYPMRN